MCSRSGPRLERKSNQRTPANRHQHEKTSAPSSPERGSRTPAVPRGHPSSAHQRATQSLRSAGDISGFSSKCVLLRALVLLEESRRNRWDEGERTDLESEVVRCHPALEFLLADHALLRPLRVVLPVYIHTSVNLELTCSKLDPRTGVQGKEREKGTVEGRRRTW